MASGLQCPGCGHVHPAALPEIARGDATFRCYGCYRTLSVPEGWTGRPAPRPPAPVPAPTGTMPTGVGTRNARAARLAARRGRGGVVAEPPTNGAAGVDAATQMVPTTGAAGSFPAEADWSGAAAGAAAGGATGGLVADGLAPGGVRPVGPGAGRLTSSGTAASTTATSSVPAGAPLGWVAPRRSERPVPTPLRVLVWMAAFGMGLLVTALALRQVGLLGVNTAIDVYAGTGVRRFGILLALLPLWAVLSATIAHFSLEALARRRPRATPTAPGGTSAPT